MYFIYVDTFVYVNMMKDRAARHLEVESGMWHLPKSSGSRLRSLAMTPGSLKRWMAVSKRTELMQQPANPAAITNEIHTPRCQQWGAERTAIPPELGLQPALAQHAGDGPLLAVLAS